MTSENGSVTTEVVLLTPVLLVLLAFVVVAGRVSAAGGDVGHAAQQAARAASLAGSAERAAALAEETARANLDGSATRCDSLVVEVDTSRFRRGGDVSVTIRCVAALGQVAFAGLPGSRELTSTAVEVIDTYRGGG